MIESLARARDQVADRNYCWQAGCNPA